MLPVEIVVNHMMFDGKEYNCAFARDISERKASEKQLAHFSAIVNSSQDAIYGSTLDGVVTSWNPGAERLYGYEAAEIIGMPISILAPAERSNEITTLLSTARDGERVELDTVRRRKDGTLVNVYLTWSAIKSVDGNVVGTVAIAHDITNRKRADELIRASEERLNNIIQNAAESIYTMSLQGVFTFVSPVWTRLLGHDVSEVQGNTFASFIHPDDVAECRAAMKGTSHREADRCTYRIHHKDGSWRWHRTAGSLVRDGQGQPAYFVGVAEDVTERLRAEEMLRASEEKYRNYISNSPAGVFVTDSTGRFVEVNSAGCRLLGYTEAELTGMRVSDIVAAEDLSRQWRYTTMRSTLPLRSAANYASCGRTVHDSSYQLTPLRCRKTGSSDSAWTSPSESMRNGHSTDLRSTATSQ